MNERIGLRFRVVEEAALKPEEIQDFEIAGLAPFSVKYYAHQGWELWRGAMFERKDGVLIASDPEERVMIYRLPKTPALDLDAAISVEWREGEVW